MAWAYDPRALAYRDDRSGQFMAHDDVMALMEKSLEASSDHTATLAQYVKDGILSPHDWRNAMRAEIKAEHIRQAILGAGGRDQMTAAHWGTVGASLRKQYNFLDGRPDSFLAAVVSGNLSEAQIAARSKLYINSARESYEKAMKRRLATTGPYDEVRWVRTASAESCDDCLDLEGRGWMPIQEMTQTPGDGSTECKGNCRCRLQYRRSDTGAMYGETPSEGEEANG